MATELAPRTSALSLSCFLFPEVPFEWHDAVALVMQLGEQLTRGMQSDPAGSLPDLSNIGIEPSGHLFVHVDPHGKESLARGLGYALHQLLTNRDGPVALRLIVTQAVSDPPMIASVEQFLRELGRWERPRRMEKLVQLHDRARQLVDNRSIPSTPPTAQSATRTPFATAVRPPARTWNVAPFLRENGALLGGAAVVLLLAGSLVFWHPFDQIFVAELAKVDSESIPSDLTPASLAAVDRGPSAGGQASRSNGSSSQAALPQQAGSDPGSSQADIKEGAAAPGAQVARSTDSATDSSPSARPRPAEPNVDPRERIYKPGDPGLVEAVLIKPYMPDHPDPTTPPERLGTLELVVDTAGNVEMVHLFSRFNRYRERWWVYIAKNWKFRPAFKDGKPVKSVKRIIITDVRANDPQ